MSQTKSSATDLRDSKSDEGPANRILTRRASRSAANSKDGSAPPASKNEEVDAAEVPQSNASSSSSTPEAGNNSARVTRSQSTESAIQNDSDVLPTRKRSRRSAAQPNSKKRAKNASKNSPANVSSRDETGTDRETRNMSQRMTKEAREAKKAQREAAVKEKLAELDQLEQTVKSGTHPEYVKLINEIESKRAARIKVTQASYEHYMANFTETFETTRKAANDHYMPQLQRQGFRRQMMQQVQQQISKLEQEFYSHNVASSLDNQHVSDWTPRHRPSRLDILFV
ncbi:hypothetical protein BJV82DRAFT_670144 [Fennellomyces sp. T-0311]|nr:hypothetical protein BJV82DRAFT_670144 [Fennellomyces sp. T-0311]